MAEQRKQIICKSVNTKIPDARPTLPVPDPNRLIIGATKNPGIFVVEECCSNIIQMAK